jgi:hypothetical protein
MSHCAISAKLIAKSQSKLAALLFAPHFFEVVINLNLATTVHMSERCGKMEDDVNINMGTASRVTLLRRG